MSTFTQAVLLGTDRLTQVPSVPHPVLGGSWEKLDWQGAKETALLSAAALVGMARVAGAKTQPCPQNRIAAAAPETRAIASPRAIVVLRQLLTPEWEVLLPEWLQCCAKMGKIIPPFYLPALLSAPRVRSERKVLIDAIGERGRWLARQKPEWSWVTAATQAPDRSLWETGSVGERLALIQHLRASDPHSAIGLVETTWDQDDADFRGRVLALFSEGLSDADESFLTHALSERRKEIRALAQSLLAKLPGSGFAARMKKRAASLLTIQRGFFGLKLEFNLPTEFSSDWKADALEEKPPAGVGEKAYGAQQIIGLVPLGFWVSSTGADAGALLALAAKSKEWGDLLLGAWYRASLLHREPEACAPLIRLLVDRPNALPPGANLPAALLPLLEACDEAQRWRIVIEQPKLLWSALPLLSSNPDRAQARSLLDGVAPAIRDGLNPGGSPAAILAAQRLPPEMHDEAARRVAREAGLSKPAEAFLRGLELRAELRAAFYS